METQPATRNEIIALLQSVANGDDTAAPTQEELIEAVRNALSKLDM